MNGEDDFIIKAENVSIQKAAAFVLKNISFVLCNGDHIAITGSSGGGKTTLGLALAGRNFYKGKILFDPSIQKNISWIEQQHHFKNLSNTTEFYYQQRFNSYDSEKTQTVEDVLNGKGSDRKMILEIMKIEYLLKKPIIQLSNGENKKLQIAKALLSQPSVLIMDQPFIGLDAETREFLHELINHLAKQGILIILITAPDEIPECITKVLSIERGMMRPLESRKEFLKRYSSENNLQKHSNINNERLKELSNSRIIDFQNVIKMKNVNVRYGEKIILQNINWEVKSGERWLLSGPNGAGKSTLLSLVTADNPQAYANEIYLFDRRRGTGESIWDIKKKIGYLSPELHLFFDQSITCFEAVASGLFDTIGLFRQLSDSDIKSIKDWMEVTGIGEWNYKRLYELSTSEQRMVLLVRAMVKNPPLLILDEPCQGLDKEKEQAMLELIDIVCMHGNKTLVFVTHYANEKPASIDHFIKLDDGKILEAGIFPQ